eukprot:2692548-Pleurochrysis_carterae.AAC.1
MEPLTANKGLMISLAAAAAAVYALTIDAIPDMSNALELVPLQSEVDALTPLLQRRSSPR